MAYLNSVSIIGNLGHDARYSVSQTTGMKKATFSVAGTERCKTNGETVENTQWFNVVAFGKLADICEKLSLTKGTCVYVGGKMTLRVYEDSDGTKKNVAELVASTLQILTPRAQKAQEEAQGETNEDDDLPF